MRILSRAIELVHKREQRLRDRRIRTFRAWDRDPRKFVATLEKANTQGASQLFPPSFNHVEALKYYIGKLKKHEGYESPESDGELDFPAARSSPEPRYAADTPSTESRTPPSLALTFAAAGCSDSSDSGKESELQASSSDATAPNTSDEHVQGLETSGSEDLEKGEPEKVIIRQEPISPPPARSPVLKPPTWFDLRVLQPIESPDYSPTTPVKNCSKNSPPTIVHPTPRYDTRSSITVNKDIAGPHEPKVLDSSTPKIPTYNNQGPADSPGRMLKLLPGTTNYPYAALEGNSIGLFHEAPSSVHELVFEQPVKFNVVRKNDSCILVFVYKDY